MASKAIPFSSEVIGSLCLAERNSILFRDLHPLNAKSSMDSIESNKFTYSNSIRPVKHPIGIFLTPDPISIDFKEEQETNAYCPIRFTESGIRIDVISRWPRKAASSISVTPSGIETIISPLPVYLCKTPLRTLKFSSFLSSISIRKSPRI